MIFHSIVATIALSLACVCMPLLIHGFTPVLLLPSPSKDAFRSQTATRLAASQSSRSSKSDSGNFLLDEFKIYNGEVLDPYKVLKVHRSAERQEIRQKYINLSRRYHPDVVMHKDILPGSW